jgi:hypothetical protein
MPKIDQHEINGPENQGGLRRGNCQHHRENPPLHVCLELGELSPELLLEILLGDDQMAVLDLGDFYRGFI